MKKDDLQSSAVVPSEVDVLPPEERGDIPRPTPGDIGSFLGTTELQELAEKAAASSENAHLRLEAAIAYITDPDCSTLKAMAEHPKFSGRVSADTLKRWRRDDGWEAYRRKFFTAWLMHVTQAAGSELVQAKRNELRALQRIQELALAKIDDPEVMPRSWEGVVKVFTDLGKRSDDVGKQLREELSLQAQMKQQMDDAEEEERGEALSEASVNELVSEVLSRRREHQRALNETNTDKTTNVGQLDREE